MRNHVFIASRRNARWIIVSVLILIMAGYARAQAPPAAQEKPQTEEQKKKAAVALDGREATKEVKQAAEATPGTKPQRAVVRAKQNEARKAETLGDWKTASELHRQAVELAKQTDDKEALADASLKYAQAAEWKAGREPAGAAKLDEAARSYRLVIEAGTPAQKRVAANNLATILLRQNKSQEALVLLRTMSYDQVPASERYVYLYNTARASELAGDGASALKLYSEALGSQPGFDPAIDGAFRVAWKSGPEGRSVVVNVGQRLLNKGQAANLLPRLHDSLKMWATDPQLQEVLALLVRCYADLAIDPDAFEKAEWPMLTALTAGPSSAAVKEIRLAFVGPLSPQFYEPFESSPIRAWRGSPWKAESYGALLSRLGDYYGRRGSFGDALARYALACSLNPREVSAALYAADVLMEHSSDVDPHGMLLNRFIETLFMSKGEAYKSDDWLNILRLHAILGTIYSRQEKWGTFGDPRGALFQFEHAMQAEQRYRSQHPEFPRSPGLYAQLGEVYLALNRPKDAGAQFLAAAAVYVQEGHSKEAREVLDRVRPILQDLSPMDQHQFAVLEQDARGAAFGPVEHADLRSV